MNKYRFFSSTALVILLTACGGGGSDSKHVPQNGTTGDTNSADPASDNSGAGSSSTDNSGSGGSGSGNSSSDSSGSGNSGSGGSGNTTSPYSPYLGGTGVAGIRLKTVTDNDSVHTFYYHSDPIRKGLLSHDIDNDGNEIIRRSYEYTNGTLSKVTVFGEDNNETTRNETMTVHTGSVNFEPINGPVISSADVSFKGGLIRGEFTKSYQYALNSSGNAYRLTESQVKGANGSVVSTQNQSYDSVGRLERIKLKGALGNSDMRFKYEYDNTNKLLRYYQGFVDPSSTESEGSQFTEKHEFSYKVGLGGVALVDTIEEFKREDSSQPWKSENIETYQYETGDCNYRYLQVFPLMDYIDSPFVKVQCPH